MQRDVLDMLWRFFSSRRLTLVLLAAIALVISSSVTFSQTPSSVPIGSHQYSHWQADIRARYLQWTDLLMSLGLFNLYSSLWFKLPLALLIVNVTVCAVEQFEAASRWPTPSAQEFDEVFTEASQSGTFVISGTATGTLTSLRAIMQGHRYKVEIEEGEESSYLSARRFSLTRWGTLLGHGGLIVAMVGLLLGGRMAWREEDISLSPGQVYQIQHVPSLSLRLDDFQVQLYPDGTPRSYRAHLAVLDEEGEERGIAAPNAPFTYRGMSFYQRTHGPAIRITGVDGEGQPISLQALVPGGEPQDAATVRLSEEEDEGYVAAPQQNLIFRLVLGNHPTAGAGESPGLLLQAYRGGVTDLLFSETILGSTSLQIEGSSYALEWGHYSVLAIVRDPSFAPTMLGATALLVAAIISLYLPPRYIWAAVSGKGDLVEMRLVRLGEGDKGGGGEFDALIQEVEQSL